MKRHAIAPKLWLPAILCAALALPGCRLGGSRSVEAENDRLRELLAEREARLAVLEGDLAELRVKLAATASGRPAATLPATLPVANALEIGRFSGFIPRDLLTPAESFRVEFSPLDGRGRFVPVAGSLRVTIDREGVSLGECELDEPALREAYRSGLVGTYYECLVPLTSPLSREGRDPGVRVRLELTDTTTGQILKGERVIEHGPSAPSR